ncbi:hypothetical protein IG193_02830 [Infirmifilum lucidum]|uniref:Uncharacterized protein n=1 Tax=Infirmifilum lucidum TaxID=2776706 RepID=A0A7L9FKF1_9CREN|nr:hypothetical protein [Infirmifilum lucidum]QOJ79414.1 hypothetical protein IG193_02830 [Infirmifilum lucidum]
MSLARIRYLSRQFRKRYGVIGRVASRYLEAGLSVRINHPTRLGPAHIIAHGNGQKLVVEVYYSSKPLEPDTVQRVAEKAKLLRAKPVVALYGKTPATKRALEVATKLGVKIKRIRP